MGWFTPEAWSHYLHIHIALGAQTAGYPSYVSSTKDPLKWM